ncbi:MAG: hypothetical protein IH899_09710, partial [Planctomycetes bacterium]|nr:hypothetical protein [Planctomycetota bacterium]
ASKKPGLKLQKFPDGPKPADTKVGRLRQIKQLARRFSATEFLAGGRSLGEMRLLPRPIYRYADPDSGIKDGAVFVLSLNGTNPDGVLVIELEQRGSAGFAWRFGPARLTNGGLSVRLDDKQVWRVPVRPGSPAAFDTWIWFRILTAKGE